MARYKPKGLRLGIGGRGKKGPIEPGYLTNNLTGMTFGRLKTLKQTGGGRWLCECSCWAGNHRVYRAKDLLRGFNRSCGCLRREKLELAAARREEKAKRGAVKPGRPKGWSGWLAGEIYR